MIVDRMKIICAVSSGLRWAARKSAAPRLVGGKQGQRDSCHTLNRLEFRSWRHQFFEESTLAQGMEGITSGFIPSIPSAQTRTPATQPPVHGGAWWAEVFEIRDIHPRGIS